jgi:hypothetical protein
MTFEVERELDATQWVPDDAAAFAVEGSFVAGCSESCC